MRARGGVVFGAIAPHGGIAVAEACTPADLPLAAATRAGLEELGRRFARAAPDATVVVTPHHVHLDGRLAVSLGSSAEGDLDGTPRRVSLRVPVDLELAVATLESLEAAGVPAAGVGFGPLDPALGTIPMDWGTLIPLWYMGGRAPSPPPIVMVSPCRDLDAGGHVRAGVAIAEAARAAGRRVAVIASADHGHGHIAGGPYGFAAESAEYDRRVVDILRRDRLQELASIPAAFVEAAFADSWWQMLILSGALPPGSRGELLSYEAPTYFGMLTAAYVPGGGAL